MSYNCWRDWFRRSITCVLPFSVCSVAFVTFRIRTEWQLLLSKLFSLFRLHEECHAFRSGDDFAAGDLQPTEIADWSGGGETGLTSIIPRSRLHSIWFSLKPNHDRAAHTHFLNSDPTNGFQFTIIEIIF